MRIYLFLAACLLVTAGSGAGAQSTLHDAGRASFGAKCALCHTVIPGGAHGAGPNLLGVLGRDVASAPGFGYSPALTKVGGRWDAERLMAFLVSPAAFAPGNVMPFAGLKSERERRALVCYLAGDAKADVCQ